MIHVVRNEKWNVEHVVTESGLCWCGPVTIDDVVVHNDRLGYCFGLDPIFLETRVEWNQVSCRSGKE